MGPTTAEVGLCVGRLHRTRGGRKVKLVVFFGGGGVIHRMSRGPSRSRVTLGRGFRTHGN